jgi:DNA-directed RNA polymerase I, II, and III subunit RPABC2
MERDELDDYQEDNGEEEEVVGTDDEEELDDQTEQQKADTAETVRLFRVHPEIWIPYKEQIQAQLHIQAEAETKEDASEKPSLGNLRDISKLDKVHTSYPFLHNYEKTKIISFRASQIANGAKPYVQVPLGVTDPYEIAHMELAAKRLPFIVKRTWPDGSYEVWKLADLVVF